LEDQGIGVLVLARVLTSLHNVQKGAGFHSTSYPRHAQHAIHLKFLANKLRNLARWVEHSSITYRSWITSAGGSLPLLPFGKYGWVTGSYSVLGLLLKNFNRQ